MTILSNNNNNSKVSRKNLTKFHKNELFNEIEKAGFREKDSQIMEDKKINSMNFNEKLFITKEKRILENFEKNSKKWDFISSKICEKNERSNEESLMHKTEEFRIKLETLEALGLIRPDYEKYGDMAWYLNLRKFPNRNKDKEIRGLF